MNSPILKIDESQHSGDEDDQEFQDIDGSSPFSKALKGKSDVKMNGSDMLLSNQQQSQKNTDSPTEKENVLEQIEEVDTATFLNEEQRNSPKEVHMKIESPKDESDAR